MPRTASRSTARRALVRWALALLGDGERKPTRAKGRAELADAAAGGQDAPAPGAGLARLRDRFALEPAEIAVLQLAWAVALDPEVARAARALSGARRAVTTSLIDERLGDGLLAARARLRTHGLVVVDGVPAGAPAAHAEVWLAPGVAAHLADEPADLEALGLGVDRLTPSDRGPVPDPLAGLVRDEIVGSGARWITVSGVGPADAERLGSAIARRLARDGIRVDGRVLWRLAADEAWTLLASARREADLAEAPLLVDGAAWVAPLLRAVSARATGAVRVILTDERRVPDVAVPSGFSARHVSIEGASAVSLPPPASSEPPLPPSVSPAIEAARRQAVVDAARAMGRALDPAPAAPVVTPASGSRPAAPAGGAARSEPPFAGRREPPPARPESFEERMARYGRYEGRREPAARPQDAGGATAANPADDAATAAAREGDATDAAAAGERAAAAAGDRAAAVAGDRAAPAGDRATPAGDRAAAVAGDRAAPAGDPAATVAAGDHAAVPAVAADLAAGMRSSPLATGDADERLPFLDVRADAPYPELLRLSREASNPFQRATLFRQIADTGTRDVQFVALLRAHVAAAHPAVRSAAEYGMQRLFGPNWNRTRPIPKPVQPLRSDDD